MLVQSTNLRPKWEMLQEVLGNPHRMLMGVGAIYENFLENNETEISYHIST